MLKTAKPWAPRAGETHEAWPHVVAAFGMALVLCVGWVAHVQAREAAPPSVRRVVALSGGDLSERGLDALASAMDPAMRTLARRIAPAPEVVLAGGAAVLGPDPT
ncbi:hypothetical protein G3573_21535, partial [Caulobacter sp. 17J65-9]|nr:hypothetical protein [Caulobacter sp. 17J65-9]